VEWLAVEYLPQKYEALNSNLSTNKNEMYKAVAGVTWFTALQ
jgi:hypothetical protein